MAQSVISKIETGETDDPGFHQVAMIAAVLECRLDELLPDEGMLATRISTATQKSISRIPSKGYKPVSALTLPAASSETALRSGPTLQEEWEAFRADLRPALLKLADVLEQGSAEEQALRRALAEKAPPSSGRQKGR